MLYQLSMLYCRFNKYLISQLTSNRSMKSLSGGSNLLGKFNNSKSLNDDLFIYEKMKFPSSGCSQSLKMSSKSSINNSFKLSDYDCVGFDLDNTLCEYNLKPLIQMEYNSLIKFLCEDRGYPQDLLNEPLKESEMDFLQRGLLLDLKRGNILKISFDGTILKACHGTREMAEEDIVKVYGSDKQWDISNAFCQDMISTWNGPLSSELRSLLDFFDISASLVFARIIDHIDTMNGRPSDSYTAGADVLAALFHIFKREHFQTEKSNFFNEMKQNHHKYALKCDKSVIKWLKQLRQSKMITFLITGSYIDFASLTAQYCLGQNWKDLFDIVICYAKKPGFFINNSPFIALEGYNEMLEVKPDNLIKGQIYSQGNWNDLYYFLSKLTGKTNPKCVYFGDNVVQDIYTPANFCRLDTVAVIEELNSEQTVSISDVWLKANKWDSYFRYRNTEDTLWGYSVRKYSKICIPSMKFISNISLDTELQTFSHSSHGEVAGFHPDAPVSCKGS